MSVTEMVGIDKAKRSSAWKVFAGLTSLGALVSTVQQLWQGDDEWIVVATLDGLWAKLLPVVAWVRQRWEQDGPQAFLVPSLVILGGWAVLTVVKGQAKSAKSKDAMMRQGMARASAAKS